MASPRTAKRVQRCGCRSILNPALVCPHCPGEAYCPGCGVHYLTVEAVAIARREEEHNVTHYVPR